MMQNSLDKLIGYFAPGLAVKRAADRVRLRAYEGASKGRRAQHWNAGRSSADTELAIAGVELRARSRDLERNNKHVAKAASVHADNIVGEGIIPRANTDDKDLNKKIDDLFDEWVEKCSPDGQQTFYSLQHQAARGMVVGGEMLARKRIRRSSDGLKIPIQIQPIEPDLLDDAKIAENASRNVVNGIEFDQIGRRTGYWMFQVHPGTQKFWGKNNLQSRKVPADQIVHLYEAQRVQARGAPWTAPILLDVKDLQEYQTAEVWRKKIEACVVGAVIPNSDDPAPTEDDNVLGVTMKDARGNNVTRMDDRIGTIVKGSVRLENGKGYATVKLSRKQMAEDLLQDLRDGHPFPVSVGYKIHRYEKSEGDDGELPTLKAIDWEPMELSAVPIPADAGAHSRSEDRETYECDVIRHVQEEAADAAIDNEDTNMPKRPTEN